jgi:large subunit ribosomal protein L28
VSLVRRFPQANNGYSVSFSHKRNKKLQHVNVQETKLFWEKENRWVRVKVAASTLRTISKVGIDEVAKRNDIDLYALPYSDMSSTRTEWLAENNKPPTKKNKRAMKHETPKEA